MLTLISCGRTAPLAVPLGAPTPIPSPQSFSTLLQLPPCALSTILYHAWVDIGLCFSAWLIPTFLSCSQSWWLGSLEEQLKQWRLLAPSGTDWRQGGGRGKSRAWEGDAPVTLTKHQPLCLQQSLSPSFPPARTPFFSCLMTQTTIYPTEQPLSVLSTMHQLRLRFQDYLAC